jgi:predicted XRE-type DNA-binding protein
LFEELGFPPADAEHYQTESHKRIEHTLALKEQLMGELSSWIKARDLKQAEAAKILHVNRPRILMWSIKNTSKFRIDALVDIITRARNRSS